jgi:hypothetical protein
MLEFVREQTGKMTDEELRIVIVRGCIGMCQVYLGFIEKRGDARTDLKPERVPGVKCFESEQQAKDAAAKCREGSKPVVFVKQGLWKDGKKPLAGVGGRIPNDSVQGEELPTGAVDFNYIVVVGDLYIDVNHGAREISEKGLTDQKVFVTEEASKPKKGWGEMWCMSCCPWKNKENDN